VGERRAGAVASQPIEAGHIVAVATAIARQRPATP
jgi:hypothetical protein